MVSKDTSTGRDIVLALLLLSGVSVGGPLFFPEVVSVADSGLLLGAVFAALIMVSVVARLAKSSMHIGRVLLLAVILGTALWGLRLYSGHEDQTEAAGVLAEAISQFGTETAALASGFAAEENTRPAPPLTDPGSWGGPPQLAELGEQAAARLAWARDARDRHAEMLDQEIHKVRAVAVGTDDELSRARLEEFEDRAALERDYWGRYWETEIAATEVVAETLAFLRATPYSLAGDGRTLVFRNDADQARFEELSARHAAILDTRAADRREYEQARDTP